jgi:hypothetical protein
MVVGAKVSQTGCAVHHPAASIAMMHDGAHSGHCAAPTPTAASYSCQHSKMPAQPGGAYTCARHSMPMGNSTHRVKQLYSSSSNSFHAVCAGGMVSCKWAQAPCGDMRAPSTWPRRRRACWSPTGEAPPTTSQQLQCALCQPGGILRMPAQQLHSRDGWCGMSRTSYCAGQLQGRTWPVCKSSLSLSMHNDMQQQART